MTTFDYMPPPLVVSANGVHRTTDLEIDVARRLVTRRGEPIELTPTEFRLLTVLASDPERVWTKPDLIARVWGIPPERQGLSRTLDSHAWRLRKNLGPDPALIETVRGIGYCLGTPSVRVTGNRVLEDASPHMLTAMANAIRDTTVALQKALVALEQMTRESEGRRRA